MLPTQYIKTYRICFSKLFKTEYCFKFFYCKNIAMINNIKKNTRCIEKGKNIESVLLD